MAEPLRVLVVEARFYQDLATEMLRGATAALEAAGATVERISVPGSFELPGVIRMAIDGGRRDPRGGFDAYVALGCVIRGETSHYDHICNEVARGIGELAMRHMAPVGFGVLTCENVQQAMVRADPAQKNKGREAAVACIKMVELAQTLRVTG